MFESIKKKSTKKHKLSKNRNFEEKRNTIFGEREKKTINKFWINRISYFKVLTQCNSFNRFTIFTYRECHSFIIFCLSLSRDMESSTINYIPLNNQSKKKIFFQNKWWNVWFLLCERKFCSKISIHFLLHSSKYRLKFICYLQNIHFTMCYFGFPQIVAIFGFSLDEKSCQICIVSKKV